jgi:NADPH-dependent 2,4-dienoyl-CoA reductase/sulfur reductase-like enzyme
VAIPGLFRSLPERVQCAVSRRVLRPAVSEWLQPRLENVTLRIKSTILGAEADDEGLALTFDDGSGVRVDHVLLATGYRVDLSRVPFLAPLARSVRLVRGSPRLNRTFESSVPGLYFVGASATESFGPLMRFVVGTGYAARAASASLREREDRAS